MTTAAPAAPTFARDSAEIMAALRRRRLAMGMEHADIDARAGWSRRRSESIEARGHIRVGPELDALLAALRLGLAIVPLDHFRRPVEPEPRQLDLFRDNRPQPPHRAAHHVRRQATEQADAAP